MVSLTTYEEMNASWISGPLGVTFYMLLSVTEKNAHLADGTGRRWILVDIAE